MKKNQQVHCRVCGAPSRKSGYLYRCKDKKCAAVHWDRSKVLMEDLDDPKTLQIVLDQANVPKSKKGKESKYVYVLRLKGEIDAVYVGKTGLHPYARYLNHIRGYKASRDAKKRATAMIGFEGPMSENQAVKREGDLAKELGEAGMSVYGGH